MQRYNVVHVFIIKKQFSNKQKEQYAINMPLLQIGELANSLSDEYKTKRNEIPWRSIIDLRHRVVHGYGALKMENIWNIVTVEVPPLLAILEEDFTAMNGEEND